MSEKLMEPVKTEAAQRICTIEEFLSANQPISEILSIPDMKINVKIKPLSLDDRERISSASARPGGATDKVIFETMTLVYGVVEPKFENSHIVKLRALNARALDKISKRIWEISGLTEGQSEAKNA